MVGIVISPEEEFTPEVSGKMAIETVLQDGLEVMAAEVSVRVELGGMSGARGGVGSEKSAK